MPVQARSGAEAPRQGVVVQTEQGPERHLHVNGTTFRIPERYNHLEVVGKGSYGVVCSAIDGVRNTPVAIKKITPMAAHSIDAKHVLREVRVMRYLGKHENIVTLEDLFCNDVEDELYIVMELLETDLHRIIQSPQVLSTQHHRVFMLQILRGVEFLHKNGIIHRDLKPGNILVTRNCELRISDFGLARERPKELEGSADKTDEEGMTEHVVTRWYRPPELMLSPNAFYGFSVDLWSVGCIFGELLGRRPLFPGSSFIDQLSLIFDVLGAPMPEEVAHIRGAQARKFLEKLKGKAGVSLSELLPGTPADACSLLETLLLFDPVKRCTPYEAIHHTFFDGFRDATGGAPRVDPPAGLRFEFEQKEVSRSSLRQLIAQEIDYFQSGANLKIHSKKATRTGASARTPPPATAVAAAAASSGPFSSKEEAAAAATRCYTESPAGDGNTDAREASKPSGQQQQRREEWEHRQKSRADSMGDDIASLDAASLQSSRLCAKEREEEDATAGAGSSDDENGEGSLVAMVGENGGDVESCSSDEEDYAWLRRPRGPICGADRRAKGRLHVEEGPRGAPTARATAAVFKFGGAYSPVRTRSGTHGSGDSCIPPGNLDDASPWVGREPEGGEEPNRAPTVTDLDKGRGGRAAWRWNRSRSRSREAMAAQAEGSIAASPIDTPTSSARSFVSPLSVPVKPTRRSSVAGFTRGSDGWEDDEAESDAGGSESHRGTTVSLLSPMALQDVLRARGITDSEEPPSASEAEGDDELEGLDMAFLQGSVGGNSGGGSGLDRRRGRPSAAAGPSYPPGGLRRERAERAWQVVGEARAKVKAEVEAEAEAASTSTVGMAARGLGRVDISHATLSAEMPLEQMARSSSGPRREGGKILPKARPPLSPRKVRASKRVPVAAGPLWSETEHDSVVFCKGGGTARTLYSSGRAVAPTAPSGGRQNLLGTLVNGKVNTSTQSDAVVPLRLSAMNVGQQMLTRETVSGVAPVGDLSAAPTNASRDTASLQPRRVAARVSREEGVPPVRVCLGDPTGDHSLRAPIASVHLANVHDLAPVRHPDHPITAGGGPPSVVSSRCSPPPVPPPLGHSWVSGKQLRRHSLKKPSPFYSWTAGHGAVPEMARPARRRDGRAAPRVSNGLTAASGLPPRAGYASGVDLRPWGRQRTTAAAGMPTTNTTNEPGGGGQRRLSSTSSGTNSRLSSTSPYAAGFSRRGCANDDALSITLTLPSRLLSPSRRITMSTQTSNSDCDSPSPPSPTCRKDPVPSGGNQAPAELTREWSWRRERLPAAASADEETEGEKPAAITATKAPQRGVSLPKKPATLVPTSHAEETVVPKAQPLTLASAMFAVDEHEAYLAENDPPPPYTTIEKPWGYPVLAAPTAMEMGSGELSPSDRQDGRDEGSLASAEQKFNLLRRLWKRSSAGKRVGELGALSTRTAGPSSFAGDASEESNQKSEGREQDAARKVLVIQAAASIPMSEKMAFKEVIASRPNKRSASIVTTSTSPASSASSMPHAAGSGLSPARLRRGSGPIHAGSAAQRRQALVQQAGVPTVVLPALRVDFSRKRDAAATSAAAAATAAAATAAAATTAGGKITARDDRRAVTAALDSLKLTAPRSIGPETDSPPYSGRAEGLGIHGDGPRVVIGGGGDQFKTPQRYPPPPSPGAAENPPPEGASMFRRERGVRRSQRGVAIEASCASRRRGTTAS